MEQEFG